MVELLISERDELVSKLNKTKTAIEKLRNHFYEGKISVLEKKASTITSKIKELNKSIAEIRHKIVDNSEKAANIELELGNLSAMVSDREKQPRDCRSSFLKFISKMLGRREETNPTEEKGLHYFSLFLQYSTCCTYCFYINLLKQTLTVCFKFNL